MKVLVLGSSASAHALAHRCSKSDGIQVIFFCPGNATLYNSGNPWLQGRAFNGIDDLVSFIKTEKIDLCINGDTTRDSLSLTSALREQGLSVIGATQACLELLSQEGVAAFLQRHALPPLTAVEDVALSFVVLSDGNDIQPLGSTRTLGRGNGSEHGSEGGFSPTHVLPPLHARIMREWVNPVVSALKAEEKLYPGFLQFRFVIDSDGSPRLAGLLCGIGEVEAITIFARLRTDCTTLYKHIHNRDLHGINWSWDRRICIVVALSTAPQTTFSNLPKNSETSVLYHHHTTQVEDQAVATNNHPLYVTGLADSLKMAQKIAYDKVKEVTTPTLYFRPGIGERSY